MATVFTIGSGRDKISSCFFAVQFVAEPRAYAEGMNLFGAHILVLPRTISEL